MIEVALSLAIIVIIGTLAIPVYQSFQVRNDLDIASNTITQSLRRAQLLAQTMEGDSNWGVKIQTSTITVFSGDNFSLRNQTWDESFNLSPTITVQGLTEIVFNKFSGWPQTSGTTTLISTINESRILVINGRGSVNY